MEHGKAIETVAVVLTVRYLLPHLPVVSGTDRIRDQLQKTRGKTEAQGVEGTPCRVKQTVNCREGFWHQIS